MHPSFSLFRCFFSSFFLVLLCSSFIYPVFARGCFSLTNASGFAVDLHALREAGLAFELRTAGFVMRDIAVHMGCHGLGLQLNVRGGGVVVCGHTTMPPGVGNPGQVREAITAIEGIGERGERGRDGREGGGARM